jgi:hypothetical protein
MITPKDDLTIKADRLARAGGPVWDDFLKAFAAYGEQRMAECVQAPSDKVFVTQGRAQECAALLDLLANAKTRAATVQAPKQK